MKTRSSAWVSVMTQGDGGVGGVAGSRRRGYMCIYSRFTSLYSRNYHNIIK